MATAGSGSPSCCTADAVGGWAPDALGSAQAGGSGGYGDASSPIYDACHALCAECSNCNFLSVSEGRRECRWYSKCNMSALVRQPVLDTSAFATAREK